MEADGSRRLLLFLCPFFLREGWAYFRKFQNCSPCKTLEDNSFRILNYLSANKIHKYAIKLKKILQVFCERVVCGQFEVQEVLVENLPKQSDDLQKKLEEGLPLLLTRQDLATYFGKLFSPAYMANLDSRGEGPAGRYRIGKKVVYERAALVEWIVTRME